jgi:response regulator RpfG family c-di-GMP phosphodiesterase
MNKILVIEDHNEIRENIVEILKLADYEVSVAKMVGRGRNVSLIYLTSFDILDAEIDGYGVLYLLNKKMKTTNIPFILLLQNQNDWICEKEWKWC